MSNENEKLMLWAFALYLCYEKERLAYRLLPLVDVFLCACELIDHHNDMIMETFLDVLNAVKVSTFRVVD